MKISIEWKLFGIYLLVLFFLAVSHTASSQVTAIHFNAGFNSANDVAWFDKLGDCEKETMSIGGNDNQAKYKIAATRKEVQDYIDELIISKF